MFFWFNSLGVCLLFINDLLPNVQNSPIKRLTKQLGYIHWGSQKVPVIHSIKSMSESTKK